MILMVEEQSRGADVMLLTTGEGVSKLVVDVDKQELSNCIGSMELISRKA